MSQETFATVLTCMDGRCRHDIGYAAALFGVQRVDTITEPGIDAILADEEHPLLNPDQRSSFRRWIKQKADISANNHGSRSCLIVGHCGCAGNPVQFDDHVRHLEKAVEEVRSWDLFDEVKAAVFDDGWKLVTVETVAIAA